MPLNVIYSTKIGTQALGRVARNTESASKEMKKCSNRNETVHFIVEGVLTIAAINKSVISLRRGFRVRLRFRCLESLWKLGIFKFH